VEALQKIILQYQEDPRLIQLKELLESNQELQISMEGLVGSQDCFVLSALGGLSPKIQVYIAVDKEDAAYIQNTLANLADDHSVLFFPDSFKRPLFFEELDKNNTVQRTETAHRINTREKDSLCIVTYPEALFEKVVDPELLRNSKIDVRVGEKLDVDTVIAIMIEFGFERVEFVYEPGQFSIRGGIIDIFTHGNEWPYRIDLFDDEVESIKTFHPATQLSLTKLSAVSLIPSINHRFKQQEKRSLFDLLPKDSRIWLADVDHLVDRLQKCFETAEVFAGTLESKTNEELRQIFDDRAFLYPKEVIEAISSRAGFHLTKNTHFAKPNHTIDFGSKPQPSFNKNFNFLIENLQKNEKEGYQNFIFTDNPKQIERFNNIFRDIGQKVKYTPITEAIHGGFIDPVLKLACYTDHQIFERFHRYKLRQGFTKDQALSLKMLRELQPGDFVVHIDHGVGRYSGLEKIEVNGHLQESLRIFYQNNDILYVSINSLHKISRYVGSDGTPPKLNKIGSDAWKTLKRKTKAKVKDIAKELIQLYAQRKASKGFAFDPDGYLQNELEASFLYEDTPDQMTATQSVKEDMEKDYPMDRLICGDVGFGKTEIAIRAAFKAITNGKQVAVLVPTTILALQHHKTFSARLGEFGASVDYINRFKSAKEKKETMQRLKDGSLDLVIGTHALLGKEVTFKDLGLLVIDEEQKFGVAAKEKLRSKKFNVDTLTLTATPIPRTLQFSLMAARDLSVIRTPPPNRQPIHTERRVFNDELIKESIYYEVNRGGQVFFVHNRVKSLGDIADMIRKLCPDIQIAVAHGQMEADQLEKTLVGFINGDFDVLVSTNIIETGLDIPNANTIIINNAHQFGMSDLHQLRGRVGRSNKKAFCYLFAPPLSVLTEEARKRLKTLEEFSDLGSGFNIAMKDLDIRGAGNLLGAEQSGFIADIGYETYQKILEEAVQELKEGEYKELFQEELAKKTDFVRNVEIDTDIEMLIPDEYVSNIQERLSLYTSLDDIESEEGIEKFRNDLRDRFGPVPEQVEELFHGLRLRWICRRLGFERITLKFRKLRCYFLANPQSLFFESPRFQKILGFLSTDGERLGMSMKQSNNFLIITKEGVKNLKEVARLLEKLDAASGQDVK